MKETTFEQAWSSRAAKKGWLSIKNIQTNLNGWPDRMFLKKGMIFFVEFKSKKGRLSKLQEYRINQIRKQGFHCFVIKSKK